MAIIIHFEKAIKRKKVEKSNTIDNHQLSTLSNAILYSYHTNLMMCEKLFLLRPGEFPQAEDLKKMPVNDAKRYIRKLNKIFTEKAEERHIKLTGKTMARSAVDRMDEWLKALLK